MSEIQCTEQLELFEFGRRQVTATFDGGQVVSDAGWLPIREFEVRRNQIERINAMNDLLIDVFVRTRKKRPAHIIIDLDPTADPTHGQQQLTMFNGFYDQHQYLPMMLFEGETRMPLGAWLRHGTAHAGLGAVEMVCRIVERMGQHWPDITIFVRGDAGVANPAEFIVGSVFSAVRPCKTINYRIYSCSGI